MGLSGCSNINVCSCLVLKNSGWDECRGSGSGECKVVSRRIIRRSLHSSRQFQVLSTQSARVKLAVAVLSIDGTKVHDVLLSRGTGYEGPSARASALRSIRPTNEISTQPLLPISNANPRRIEHIDGASGRRLSSSQDEGSGSGISKAVFVANLPLSSKPA